MKKLIKILIWKVFGKSLFFKCQTLYWARRLKNMNYEKEIDFLPKFIFPGSTVLDIGANCGQYTYTLSKLVGRSGKVISFEPVKYTFDVLRIIVKKLKLKNVELHNIALSNKKGKLEIKIPLDNFGIPNIGLSSFTNNDNVLREIVKADTLDNFLHVKNVDFKKILFIKCDVEGFELFVLKGGINCFKLAKPTLLIEVDDFLTRKVGYSANELFEFLRKLGYRPYVICNNVLRLSLNYSRNYLNYFFVVENMVPDILKAELKK